MARSLDLDALSEEDLRMLIEEILNRLPAQELLLVRDLAEAKRREKLDEAKHAVIEEMRGKLEGLGLHMGIVGTLLCNCQRFNRAFPELTLTTCCETPG